MPVCEETTHPPYPKPAREEGGRRQDVEGWARRNSFQALQGDYKHCHLSVDWPGPPGADPNVMSFVRQWEGLGSAQQGAACAV